MRYILIVALLATNLNLWGQKEYRNRSTFEEPAKLVAFIDLGTLAHLTISAGVQYRWNEKEAFGVRPGWYTETIGTRENVSEYMNINGLAMAFYYRRYYRKGSGAFFDLEAQAMTSLGQAYRYEFTKTMQDGVEKYFYSPIPTKDWFLQPSIGFRLGQENTRSEGFWTSFGFGFSYKFGSILGSPTDPHRDWYGYFKPAYSGLSFDLILAFGARIH